MKNAMIIAVLLTAAVFSGIAKAGELSDISLDKLLILSGATKQISQFPNLLRIGMDRARKRDEAIHNSPSMSDAEYSELENTMTDAFKPARILKSIDTTVKHSLSEQEARKMLAWYGSKLGKRINEAEEQASVPEDYGKIVGSAKVLLANKKRVQFAKNLDALLHITDTTMQFQINLSLAMFVAFSSKINPHQPVNIKIFRKILSAHLREERPRIERLVVLSILYTYKKIGMNSLEKYLTFLKSPEAMRFNKSLITGTESGMTQSMEQMSRMVMSLFKKNALQQI